MQDAKAAADELERCVRDLKFCGAMINGHTNGKYLDDRSYDPFWERAAALDAPVYVHPADPVAALPVLAGYNVLVRQILGWASDGSHALRIISGGVFHRYPKAKLLLGHLGETLPFLLWRFDSRSKPYGWNLPKPPSQYIKENVWVTMSGMYDGSPLHCSIGALGRDHVMFSADYPFDAEGAGPFMDTVQLDEPVRADVAYNNAKLFRCNAYSPQCCLPSGLARMPSTMSENFRQFCSSPHSCGVMMALSILQERRSFVARYRSVEVRTSNGLHRHGVISGFSSTIGPRDC
jgi:2,3-dihydroxybenzoate decarboxylase